MGQRPSRSDSPPTGFTVSSSSSSQCPIPRQSPITPSISSASCPIQRDNVAKPAQCPIDHNGLNPLNQMPQLAQARASNQTIDLPLNRTESSIPKDASSKWEYPSPQQFYNALIRKGWETPEEHVETMVDIHNFLNEQAWMEVLKWEKRRYK